MVVIFDSLCQRIREVGLVLWIDANTFATGLLERVFKKKNLPFYTLDNVSDFAYLVEDLKPHLLVLDAKTAEDHLEALKGQFEASETLRNLPVVMIDENSDIPFIQNKIGGIRRPFDPFKIPDMLQNILIAN